MLQLGKVIDLVKELTNREIWHDIRKQIKPYQSGRAWKS